MAVKTKAIEFDELVKQNERRVHYQIHKRQQDNQLQGLYSGGLFAKWHAYKKYKPQEGVLSTYFNYTIRERW